ncbi:MAG: hypothetical protein AAGI53_04830 [Planctomycetota bacterium]
MFEELRERKVASDFEHLDDQPSTPMVASVNTYRLPEVLWGNRASTGTAIIVSERVKSLLTPVCTAAFMEVAFEQCFSVPVEPDCHQLEVVIPELGKMDIDDAMVRIRKKYKAPPPLSRYFEVLAKHVRLPDEPVDYEEFDVEIGSGFVGRDDGRVVAATSESRVSEHGLVMGALWSMSSAVDDVLWPFLPFPWIRRIEV